MGFSLHFHGNVSGSAGLECMQYVVTIIYVIVIPWARVLGLIYTHLPEGCRPESKCVYIRQSTSAHGITDLLKSSQAGKKWCSLRKPG